jgi:hypothetical protein
MSTTAYFDTMMFLHFQKLDQLDLAQLLGDEDITIRIARVTITELDEQKNSHPSSKIRDRARSILHSIEEWTTDEGHRLPNGARIVLCEESPANDRDAQFKANWADDQLIASILSHKNKKPADRVVLVTDDSGPRFTARRVGIETIRFPDTLRLPPDLDAQEKEIQRLKTKLLEIQAAQPELTLIFISSEAENRITVTLPAPIPYPEDNIRAKLLNDAAACPPISPPKPSTLGGKTVIRADTESILKRVLRQQEAELRNIGRPILLEEYDRYERERSRYLGELEDFYRKEWAISCCRATATRLQLAIRNDGGSPAEDIDVNLHFPDGMDVYTEDSFPKPPTKPHPPPPPGTNLDVIMRRATVLRPPRQLVGTANGTSNTSSLSIRRTNSYEVSWKVHTIKHGTIVNLPLIVLTFDTHNAAQSFHISYLLRPRNLREACRGELHVIVTRA